MMPKINPREMQRAMQRMGIKQEEIDAEEVIIRCADKEIIIKNPDVQKIDMAGNKSFQISGDIHERAISKITEEDIKTVMDQAEVSKEKAIKALEDNDGDLAAAILSLKE
jgi:nascent polypeptide-associated complex subunit alpha